MRPARARRPPIRTADGDLILDNRADAVLRLNEVAYEFIKRESSHAVEWLFLERETTIAMVAMSQ